MMKSLFAPFTTYPMHLNAAGVAHRFLAADTLSAKAHRCDTLAQAAHTRWQVFSGELHKATFSSCAAGAAATSTINTGTDWLFGNMSADPGANPLAIKRTGGVVGALALIIATNTTLIVPGRVLAGGCLLGVVAGGAYRSDGWKVALDRGYAVFTMPILYLFSQASALTGALIKATVLLPCCLVGVGIGLAKGAWAASQWQKDQHVLSAAITNETDFVDLDPVDEIPKTLLFVTDDHYAFNVADLVAYNRNRESFLNPHTMKALSPTSRQALLRHPSGLGVQLLHLESTRADAAKAISAETIDRAHALAKATRMQADPLQKEVAIIQFADYLDTFSHEDRKMFDLAFTSSNGETFSAWMKDLNAASGAYLNRMQFPAGQANTNPMYDVANAMPCTEGFSHYMRRCVGFIRSHQPQENVYP